MTISIVRYALCIVPGGGSVLATEYTVGRLTISVEGAGSGRGGPRHPRRPQAPMGRKEAGSESVRGGGRKSRQ